MELSIYTDGACSGNPGAGGWGVVMLFNGEEKIMSGGEQNTTNNRMELTAIINGLEAIKRPVHVTVYSDSKYAIDGITKWINVWKHNGWKTSAKKPVANSDLWQRLDELDKKYQPKYVWVKGHADNKYNNLCDELAVAAIAH
jgi:ribonuclease HI